MVLELAEETAAAAAPGAWFVDFTNPTGLVTQALLDEGHRALGLCNVAIGFQRRFAAHFDVGPERVQLEHVGLNHLTWERKVLVDGVDRLPEILDSAIDLVADETDMPAELIRDIGAIPSYYLHYYYLTDRVLEQQRTGKTRAEEVMEIEAGLLELYKDPALDTKPKLLEERGGAFYSDAAAALVASLHAGTDDVQVVNVRNDGADPEPRRRRRGRGRRAASIATARTRSPSTRCRPRCSGWSSTRRRTSCSPSRAAMSGDRGDALKALMTNPLIGDYDTAKPLLGALLDANRDHLPRFFAGELTSGAAIPWAARRRAAGPSRRPRRRPRCPSSRRGRRSP